MTTEPSDAFGRNISGPLLQAFKFGVEFEIEHCAILDRSIRIGHSGPMSPGSILPMDTSQRPTISVPDGDAPTELSIEDHVIGDGPEATAGSQANVDYVGVSWSTGAEFDASWNRGDPLSFTIGAGQVISGWDQGVAGMKVGGRRTITIPPDLGYGAAGAGGVIGPNETLIFTVDLRSIG